MKTVATVQFNAVRPFDDKITAVADLGANIQAINRTVANST
jgi:hypothetical protein